MRLNFWAAARLVEAPPIGLIALFDPMNFRGHLGANFLSFTQFDGRAAAVPYTYAEQDHEK